MQRLKGLVKQLLRAPRPAPPAPSNKALWAIGIHGGPSPLALEPGPTPGAVLTRDDVTDVPASFVADPFLVSAGGIWHMYFEVLNRRTGRGEIGLATSADLASWRYERIVLAEPFHLSYPLVFEWEGAHYMVPETYQSRTIRLYRADPFPGTWTFVHTLLSGRPFTDATPFRHDGRWWMFTEASDPQRNDTLRLYFADDLFGPWTEHPASPIVHGDARSARPAGRVVSIEGRLHRFTQDCTQRYGARVDAFEIETLTTDAYVERPVAASPVLAGSGVVGAWNASRMHHVDAHLVAPGRWVAAVDGARDVTAAHIAGAE